MSGREHARALAIARLAQELAVPAHLLNLHPAPANHWADLLPEGWRMETVSRGRRWGRTRAAEDWRAQAWASRHRFWETLYGGPPAAPDEFGDRCYPGAYPCTPPPCPTFEGWPE